MSSRTSGSIPKPGAAAAAAFATLLPEDPDVTSRPMFGNPAAFVNGNLFTGLFGDNLFVRLSELDEERLRAEGGTDFAPMPGRPMKGYATLPAAWSSELDAAGRWVAVSLAWAKTLRAKARTAGGAPRRKR